MKPLVTILAPGAMGSAIAAKLVAGGLDVRTSLEGRSAQTAQRAAAAGMRAVGEAELLDVDVILAVVPPGDAPALARRVAQMVARHAPSGRLPIYVDCNAVNPATATAIGQTIEAAGLPFVDGSIIGMPPREGYAGPTLFVSGDRAAEIERLAPHGLAIRVLDAPAGAASALKMAYGGITKGLIAIGAAMILGAERAGVAEALREEMARSQSTLLAGFGKSIPDMFSKAGRWVAEMEEISQFLDADSPQGRAYADIAAFYDHLSGSAAAPDIEALAGFFESDGKR